MFVFFWLWSFYVDVFLKVDVKVCLEFVECFIYFYDWDIFIVYCFEMYDLVLEYFCDQWVDKYEVVLELSDVLDVFEILGCEFDFFIVFFLIFVYFIFIVIILVIL